MAVLPAPQIPTNGTDAPQAVTVLTSQPWTPMIRVLNTNVLPAPPAQGVVDDAIGFPTSG